MIFISSQLVKKETHHGFPGEDQDKPLSETSTFEKLDSVFGHRPNRKYCSEFLNNEAIKHLWMTFFNKCSYFKTWQRGVMTYSTDQRLKLNKYIRKLRSDLHY